MSQRKTYVSPYYKCKEPGCGYYLHHLPNSNLVCSNEYCTKFGYKMPLSDVVNNYEIQLKDAQDYANRVVDDLCTPTSIHIRDDDHQSLTFGPLTDDPRNKAMRFNSGKPQISLVLSTGIALDGVSRVMEFGAQKYERDNWKKGLHPISILDSMLRHIRSYLDGEYIDPDSGLPHVDHIACNALFLGYHTDREGQDGMKSE